MTWDFRIHSANTNFDNGGLTMTGRNERSMVHVQVITDEVIGKNRGSHLVAKRVRGYAGGGPPPSTRST